MIGYVCRIVTASRHMIGPGLLALVWLMIVGFGGTNGHSAAGTAGTMLLLFGLLGMWVTALANGVDSVGHAEILAAHRGVRFAFRCRLVAALMLIGPAIVVAVLITWNNGMKDPVGPIVAYSILAFGGMTLAGGAVGAWLSRPIVGNPALRLLGAAIVFVVTVVSPPFLYILRRFEGYPINSAWKIALVGVIAWAATALASPFAAERRM
jgi:hypothetical protein